MDFIKDFISVLGLNGTFFIQFAWAAVLYIIVKKYLISPYYKLIQKRSSVTDGKIQDWEDLKQEIENLKKSYEVRVQTLNKKFQEIFSKEKEKTDLQYQKEFERISLEREGMVKKINEDQINMKREILKQMESEIQNLASEFMSKILK